MKKWRLGIVVFEKKKINDNASISENRTPAVIEHKVLKNIIS